MAKYHLTFMSAPEAFSIPMPETVTIEAERIDYPDPLVAEFYDGDGAVICTFALHRPGTAIWRDDDILYEGREASKLVPIWPPSPHPEG